MNYHGVWTIAETNRGKIKEVSFELLTRRQKLADKLGTYIEINKSRRLYLC